MTIDEMIEVLQAAKRGETIQYRAVPYGDWFDNPCVWNFTAWEYRVKRNNYAWDRDECISETPPNGGDEQPACPICSKRAARMKRLPQWFHDLADRVDTSDDWVCENPDAIHRVLEHLDYSVLEDLVGCLVDMVEELKKTT